MKRKANYLLAETKELVCPMCKKKTQPEQTRLQQIRNWMQLFGGWNTYDIVEEARSGNFNDWGCRSCEANGSVIFPDYSKQNYGSGGPLFMYINKMMSCSTCKSEFLFSASEQQHWYETLQFNYSAYPKECLACRKEKRIPKLLHKKLSELLKQEVQDADTLTAIAELYERLGITDKAGLFYARAKNKRR